MIFKSKVFFIVLFLFILNFFFAFINKDAGFKGIKNEQPTIKGITVVAPPKAIDGSAFIRLKEINTEWVSFVPYGFTKKGTTEIRYNLEWQWWGEKISGVESCIREAKNNNLKVMLKPQVFIGGGWIGEMDFKKEEDWLAWEENYKKFIFDYVEIAAKYNIEMFCIGTEYNIAIVKRDKFWRSLIKEVRKKFNGKITYSANWDQYDKVKVWDDLDFIGISSYFPLSDAKNPTVGLLMKEWKPVIRQLKAFSEEYNKKVLFTEYGYMSVDGCAGKAWEIEKNIENLNINHFAQSNAYDALWSSLSKEKFWAGGFLWKWFPNGMGHEGYPEKDYTPQDKPAELIIKKWFSQKQKF